MNRFTKFLVFSLILVSTSGLKNLTAAEPLFKITPSVDLVSLYNWRAIDFGDAPAIQPKLAFQLENFDFSIWGSQSLIARKKRGDEVVAHNEIDFWIRYRFETPIGVFMPKLLDYYFPWKKKSVFNYDGVKEDVATGSHGINLSLTYIAPGLFPVRFFIENTVYNDPDKPLYVEVGLPFKAVDTECEFVVGAAKGLGPFKKASSYNLDTDKFTICNIQLNATKAIKITDNFDIPITASAIIHPYTKEAWFVIGAKIR